MKKVVTFLFIICIFILPIHANLDSLLKGIEKINNIKPVEPPRNYISNDLFVMIDGGAETYLEYGFVQALDVSYTFDSTKRIGIQIYEMTDDGAAFGIHTSSRNEGDHNLQIGDFSFGNEFYIMSNKSKFFFIVSADENSPEIQKIIADIGMCIASNIKEKTILPELVSKGLSAGYRIENLKYIRGKIALSANYFFAHKEVFNTRNVICIKDGDCLVFVFEYSDDQSASSNLNRVKEELISSGRYSQFNIDESKFSCLDKNLKFVKIQVSHKYLITTIGKVPSEEVLNKIISAF